VFQNAKRSIFKPLCAIIQECKKSVITKNRQDENNLYMPNGAIFIYDLKNFKNNFFLDKVLFFLMDKKTSIDIDTKQDYKLSKLYSKTLK
jgi:CMP-N-acetylneuraminic acid synthetase